MRNLVILIPFLTGALGHGETLSELLIANRVPTVTLGQEELAHQVQGSIASNGTRIVISYRELKDNIFFGPLRVLRYDSDNGKIIRVQHDLANGDLCSGSPEQENFIGEFTLVPISLSPSAECLLVLDNSLKLRTVLYGFEPVEVLPGAVVLIEDMIHFAPVHPERLQLAELKHGKTVELYPPKEDLLRARLSSENAKMMPSQKICGRMNDPCNPRIFDEDIGSMTSDGKGRFAFLASQSASHATAEEQEPEMVASQTVLYVYQHQQAGWRYCEREVSDKQRAALAKSLETSFDNVVTSCTPHLSVAADMSTADYNPFLNRPFVDH